MSETKNGYQYSKPTDSAADEGSPIEAFRGEFDFLSNFFETPIEIEGLTYPTGEHAFQALKTHESAERYRVLESPTPASAKARGKKVTLREGWDTARFEVMEAVLRVKFRDPQLRRRLLATGERELIEGNTCRDTTWGAIRARDGGWKGRNELGKLLMRLRAEFREEEESMADHSASDRGRYAELIAAAFAARERAYAPYSGYRVGAAVLTESGEIVPGANVENASYGLSNCAERTAIFTAVVAGARAITAVAVATDDGGTPCGACRQVLMEFAPRDDAPLTVFLIDRSGASVRETTLALLLPDAFSLR